MLIKNNATMFNFQPLGKFVVFLLAIAAVVGLALLGFFAIVVEYFGLVIAAYFAICLIAWIAGWFREKLK